MAAMKAAQCVLGCENAMEAEGGDGGGRLTDGPE